MKQRLLYVGLDVHKNTTDVAIANGRSNGKVRFYDMIFTSFPEGALLRKGEPSFLLWESETPDHRQRKLRDENKSCGSQPAYISMIIRRY